MDHSSKHTIHQQQKPHHRILNIICILGLLLAFLITAIFNGLAGSGAGKSLGIFNSDVGNLSDLYDTTITPSGWAFSIWSIIYTWLSVTFVWYIITIFLTNSYGPVYLNPCIATPLYCIIFIVNLFCNLAWIFVWDNQLLIAASVLLFLIAITNVMQMVVVARNLAKENHVLKVEQKKTYWTYVILSLNGPAIYTTWTVIASLLNFTIALHYSGSVSMIDCTRISLSCLLVVMVTWFVLENTVLDRAVRFIVTPYLVVIWASYAIIDANSSDDSVPAETDNFVKGIFGVAIALYVIRVAILIYRQIRKPIRDDRVSPINPISES